MRSRFFGKRFKSSCILTIVAVVLLSFVCNFSISARSAHAVSMSEAESLCGQMGGTFTDNSQSESAQSGADAPAKCTGITSSNASTTCSNNGGTYSANTSSCYWMNIDEVEVAAKSAKEVKTLCESTEGAYFVDATANYLNERYIDCMGMTNSVCNQNGGTIILSAQGTSKVGCRWTNFIADLDTSTTTSDNDTTEATCSNSAGSVGWFVCPILDLAARATNWAYESVIEPSLKVRVDLFQTTGESNGTFQAWSTFRDVANIAFVILLLVVILSQVTGIGIDNYGIKKTLPNLIVAAILVNLSFIVCQALVDLSNITGSGVYDLINKISEGITVTDIGLGADIGRVTSIIGTIAMVVAGVGVAAAVTGGFWTMLQTAFLAVLPVFISAVVAVLLLFFLLAMRQAIVVMLVAIAPLAFVCYTLPNTKKLFTRWAELLRGMLLLYPICALMIAGGRLASKIILASGAAEDNLFLILVAMVAEAGPLFLIPGLTRSAYRATGQLGTALNGLRARWTGGARNAVRNNRTYQNAQARNQRRRITSGINRRRVNRFNAAQERLQGGATSYAPGLRGRARRARDYMTTRAGNAERVAGINEQALAAEEQQRKINRMSNAEQVEGMRQQAAISANQQNVKNADYADATFANAVIQQAETEHEASRDRQMLYNNTKYVQGKRNANDLALENEFYSTRQNANADFVEGKRQEARLGREGERARAGLYTNVGYVDSRRNQQQAVISGEITKMYTDQFSRLSMTDIMGKLRDASVGTDTSGNAVANRTEQFTAAANALIQAGQADKVREVISGGRAEYATAAREFGNLVRSDETFRNRASQVLGSSGEFTFQEYAKHLGQSTIGPDGKSDARSFRDWSDATDNKSLKASIEAKGLDKMDKDGFAYLANHVNALQGASDANIAKVAANTTDAATVAKLANAITKLDATRRDKIMSATSGAQFVNMNETVRVALATGGTTATTAGDAAWKAKVGATIAADPQLRGRLNATEQGRYI